MDDRHSEFSGGLEVEWQVVDEHALLRAEADLFCAELIDLRRRLADPDLARDDDGVEKPSELFAVVASSAPGVRDQAGLDAVFMRAANRLDHLGVRTRVREQAVDQVLGVDADALCQLPLEMGLLELSCLEADQQRAALPVLAEAPAQVVRLESLERAERSERVEQVAGENAPVVDEQPAIAAVLRSHVR